MRLVRFQMVNLGEQNPPTGFQQLLCSQLIKAAAGTDMRASEHEAVHAEVTPHNGIQIGPVTVMAGGELCCTQQQGLCTDLVTSLPLSSAQ
jgi:hypothetical protein